MNINVTNKRFAPKMLVIIVLPKEIITLFLFHRFGGNDEIKSDFAAKRADNNQRDNNKKATTRAAFIALVMNKAVATKR